MVHFHGTDYRSHTVRNTWSHPSSVLSLTPHKSCITEDQKYQGALYRNKKAKTTANSGPSNTDNMAHAAYVEDVADDAWRDYEQHSDDDDHSVASPMPEAPTPPSANDAHVNVFDFLVANPTPTASHLSLPATNPVQLNEETQLVRFDYEANELLDTFDLDDSAMIQYGDGPVPTNFRTPGPKMKKPKETASEIKKDKKRKRLHVETDMVMTDAPPVLHSGLTGGLKGLMTRNVFPPSPDYSGAEVAETPASPLKKSKHLKHHKSSRAEGISNSLMAMITAGGVTKTSSKSGSKTKSSKRKSSSTSSKKKSSHKRLGLEAPKEQKLLEYRPGSKDSKEGDGNGQMVLFKPRAEHFLSFVNKGPESERGCSVNKALKRYHRERSDSGTSLSKLMEEKELWRSLRMRKNERGEIVLFCI